MSGPILGVLVPTRERPHTVIPLAEAFAATSTAATWLVYCIDGYNADDGDCRAYENAYAFVKDHVYPRSLLVRGPRRRLVGTLNYHSRLLANTHNGPYAIGYMGDDHRPETTGWDTAILAALREAGGTGIAYGDDGHQHEALPTAVVITSDIIATLGHMAPATLTHMYCDNYWKDLGLQAGCLTYLPDVVIRHRHPGLGLGQWDASYRESNSSQRYTQDREAYADYQREQLPKDVAAVQALRGAA